MRVLCIDAEKRNYPDGINSACGFEIKEGSIYTIHDAWTSRSGIPCYSLKEDPDRDYGGYAQDRFIPCSEIDETEMIREPAVEVCDARDDQ